MHDIYTDGSCIPNPGPGGWAFIVTGSDDCYEWRISGGEPKSTNNRMELMAIIESLKFVENGRYVIHSDSTYAIKGAQNITKRKSNIDLWLLYDEVSKGKELEWIWVKGHSGDHYNEIVDVMAKAEAKKWKK